MYGFPSSSSFDGLMNYGAGAAAMIIIGIIGAIVATVIIYIKFVGKNADASSPVSKFFRFEHLYIVNILEIVYLFAALITTIFCIITPFIAAAAPYGGGFGTFFSTLIAAIIMFCIIQIILRISYELTLMVIRFFTDTHDVRNVMVGDNAQAPKTGPSWGASQTQNPMMQTPPQPMPTAQNWSKPASAAGQTPQQGMASSTARSASSAHAATAPTPAAHPTATATPARKESWDCSCGATGNTGNFCAKCGKPRP